MASEPVVQSENIGYGIAWLCGAVFLAAPVVIAAYLLRHRGHKAFQCFVVATLSFTSILMARALMLSAGLQSNGSRWLLANLAVMTVSSAVAAHFSRKLL